MLCEFGRDDSCVCSVRANGDRMNELGVGKVSLQHMHVWNARTDAKNASSRSLQSYDDNNKAVML